MPAGNEDNSAVASKPFDGSLAPIQTTKGSTHEEAVRHANELRRATDGKEDSSDD